MAPPGRKRSDGAGENGHPFYPLGGMTPLTKQQADLCARRVGGLATFGEAHRPLKELLANAYWLGLADAADLLSTESTGARSTDGRSVVPGSNNNPPQVERREP